MTISETSALCPAPQMAAAPSVPTYTIQRHLGDGFTSRVFLGRDPSGRLVAIKQMHSKSEFLHSSFPKDYVHRIFSTGGPCQLAQEELATGRELHHPHIMKAYTQFLCQTEDGQIHTCLSQEYVAGKTLAQIPRRSFSQTTTVKYSLQLIRALQHAFSKQYGNFDILDTDVMIDKNGIKLIDLGGFQKILTDDGDDDDTNRKYVQHLYTTIFGVLEKGKFSRSEEAFIEKKLMDLVKVKKPSKRTAFDRKLDEKFTVKSFKFLSFALGRIQKIIERNSHLSHPAYRHLHPTERLAYRLFISRQAKKV